MDKGLAWPAQMRCCFRGVELPVCRHSCYCSGADLAAPAQHLYIHACLSGVDCDQGPPAMQPNYQYTWFLPITSTPCQRLLLSDLCTCLDQQVCNSDTVQTAASHWTLTPPAAGVRPACPPFLSLSLAAPPVTKLCLALIAHLILSVIL